MRAHLVFRAGMHGTDKRPCFKAGTMAILALLALWVTPAEAHKLKVFASVEGGVISGYGFFVGGGRPRGAEVIIRDKPSNKVVYRGDTDSEGRFSFKPASAANYTISLDTREGHMAESYIGVDRFPVASTLSATAASAAATPGEPGSVAQSSQAGASDVSASDIDRIVETAVARQVRPLLERIEALDDRLRLADVIAGICMILGLGGIGLWATTRHGSNHKQGSP